MLLVCPWELKDTGKAKLTPDPWVFAAGVLGNTADCTRSDAMAGVGIVQPVQKPHVHIQVPTIIETCFKPMFVV